MQITNTSTTIQNEIKRCQGIFRLEPAWVARDFLPPGRRLGLPPEQYELGARGGICERWLASTTRADNKVKVADEGLSFIKFHSGERIRLKDAIEAAPELMMGKKYARRYKGLRRLAKIFDYADRLPYHIHQMEKHARLVGCNSKEEAYYFPEDVPMGDSPDTYFGVHPYIARQKKYDLLLPHLIAWQDDSILQYSQAYKQMPGDGFHVPAGTLHAPGSALTIELQEDSDVFAMLQAKTMKGSISKDLLFKDVRQQDRKKWGEKYILKLIDWKINGDPYFYENRHTPPLEIKDNTQDGGKEFWIFYNTKKFSGKKLVVFPGAYYISRDKGIYNVLVWRGRGTFGQLEIKGQDPDQDELLVCHERAVEPIRIENHGADDLIIYKFFGPDINPDVPFLKPYPG